MNGKSVVMLADPEFVVSVTCKGQKIVQQLSCVSGYLVEKVVGHTTD